MRNFLRNELSLLRNNGLWQWFRFNAYLLRLRVRANEKARSRYRLVDAKDLASLRRSNRVYVFGSGFSLNDLTANEWSEIEMHDTIGFNGFVRQRWIRVDFHLVRGWGEGANVGYNWQREVTELAELINDNPCYQDTVFLLQDEHFAQVSRVLVAEELLKSGVRIARYHTAPAGLDPSVSLVNGLRHLSGTLSDAVNLAFCLGWNEIVLVGVDLYDTRYFWLGPEETLFTNYKTGESWASATSDRGQRFNEPHSTVQNGAIDEMARWAAFMRRRGVEMFVYNPRSLLSKRIPTLRRACS
jgi:hypothetical protein